MLLPNQIYELTVNTPCGMYTYRFVTEVSPLYSTYDQLLLDTGLTAEQLSEFDGLRFLHQASLICNDILELTSQKIPSKPTLAMRQYTRYRAARDAMVSKLRSITYTGRETVSHRLADLTIERRPAITSNELDLTVRALEKELAYWDARLRSRYPMTSAVRAGTSYPYPLNPRVIS